MRLSSFLTYAVITVELPGEVSLTLFIHCLTLDVTLFILYPGLRLSVYVLCDPVWDEC